MTFTPTLFTESGSIEALPIILLCDHLKVNLHIENISKLPQTEHVCRNCPVL